jgi:hypothetical protein
MRWQRRTPAEKYRRAYFFSHSVRTTLGTLINVRPVTQSVQRLTQHAEHITLVNPRAGTLCANI